MGMGTGASTPGKEGTEAKAVSFFVCCIEKLPSASVNPANQPSSDIEPTFKGNFSIAVPWLLFIQSIKE